MRPSFLVSFFSLAPTALSQVPCGALVVSAFDVPTLPPGAGLFVVAADAPHTVTPIAALPCELTGTCGGSSGASFVARDARSGALLSGSFFLGTSGPLVAFELTLAGTTVAATRMAMLGTGNGVHAAVVLPDDDVLLALADVTAGPFVGSCLVRWTRATGALSALPLPGHPGSSSCEAVALSPDRSCVVAALVDGTTLAVDLVQVPLDGSPVAIVATLPGREFVTGLAWSCAGELQATSLDAFALAPSAVRTWSPASAGGWTLTSVQTTGATAALNDIDTEGASCRVFLADNDSGNQLQQLVELRPDGSTATIAASANAGWSWLSGVVVAPCPEVVETATGAGPLSHWAWRPFPGGAPTLGNASFALPLRTGPGTAVAFALFDTARTGGNTLLPGLVWFLPPTAVSLGLGLPPDPAWPLPIPANPALRGLPVFAQALVFGQNQQFSGSDLLQFALR